MGPIPQYPWLFSASSEKGTVMAKTADSEQNVTAGSRKPYRMSHFDRMKSFQKSIPPSTPISVKYIMCVMFTYAHDDGSGIFASVETICEHSGENERAVQRAIAYMRQRSWIEDDGYEDHGSGQRTKRRRIVTEQIQYDRDQELNAENDKSGGLFELSGDNPGKKGVTNEVKRGDTSVSCSNIDKPAREPPSNNLPDSTSSAFDLFCHNFPRKVGKGAAEKAFRSAVKTSPPSIILAALDRQRPELLSRSVEYRPHPATWLNQKRWLDEVSDERPVDDPAGWHGLGSATL
jgi:hypothetical protein